MSATAVLHKVSTQGPEQGPLTSLQQHSTRAPESAHVYRSNASINTSTVILADFGSITPIYIYIVIMPRGRKREKPDTANTEDLMTSPLGTCLLKLFALGIIMEA